MVVVIVAGAVGGCSDRGAANPPAASSEDGVHFLVDMLRARSAAGLRTATFHRSLDELLPVVKYRREDGPLQSIVEAAVLGRVVDVEKGRAFAVAGDDSPSGTEVPFDAPGARCPSGRPASSRGPRRG